MGAVAQAFQQMLLPDPADYRYAELPMIEQYEEVFGGREAELADLVTFLTRNDQPELLLRVAARSGAG